MVSVRARQAKGVRLARRRGGHYPLCLMAKRLDIAILGPGKVGTALGALAARAGWRIRAVGGRKPGRARRAAAVIRPAAKAVAAPLPLSLEEAARAGELVLLTVPDDAIECLCSRLARSGALRPGSIVAHCSGALGSDALRPAAERGCAIGSLHPLQTFPTVEAAMELLPGSYFFIEGGSRAAGALSQLARDIGGVPVRLNRGKPGGRLARGGAARAKALYHASACIASNYLVAVVDAALAAGELAGIARARRIPALEPLLRATLENALRMGPRRALTGPIARGDAATVRRHLVALRQANPELADLYKALAKWTIPLARRKGTLRPAEAAKLTRLIRSKEDS
jgi:predicted short-subunit dehydrogenase-like oxidoreductase (DUF2520 family)